MQHGGVVYAADTTIEKRSTLVKKIFFAFLAFILAILAIGGIFAYVQYQNFDKQYGLSEAPALTHEPFITPLTRTQVVLNPEKLKGFIQRHLPPEFQVPSPLNSIYNIENLLEKALPRRVALLANADYTRGGVFFTAFVNERVGGPFVAQEINGKKFLDSVQGIMWADGGLQLPERGNLNLGGSVPLPEGLDVFIMDNGFLGGPQIVTPISGEHLFEIALDNGNGEMMALAGMAMGAFGMDWKQIFNAPEFKMALPLFNKTNLVKAHADLVTDDEMAVHLRVEAMPEAKGIYNLIKNMGMPEIKKLLSANYQIELIGDPEWIVEENAFVGDFTVKGVEKYLALPLQNIKR